MLVIKDFATTTLAAALTAGATSIVVSDASRLPTLSAGDYFYLVLQKFTDRSYVEIVKVTGISSNTLTVVRAQAGTTAKAFAIADYAELRLTKGTFDEYLAQMVAGKVDMTSGYVNQKLDLFNTADSVKGGVGVVYDATNGHGTVLSGGEGANKLTPHILLRPLGMVDASVQAKYGSDGSLILTGGSRYVETGLLSMKHPADANGWPNATNSNANNYNNRARGKIHVNNNALYFIADATHNARRFGIQSGHEHPDYATAYGILDLNPYGGTVRVNGGTVYHTNYVPTPAAVGALALSGGILTGVLNIEVGGYGLRFAPVSGVGYLQGGKVGGDTADQKLKITGMLGNPLTEFEILTSGHGIARVNGARIYTEQYVPTPDVLGVVPQARTINSKPLTSNIVIDNNDVGSRAGKVVNHNFVTKDIWYRVARVNIPQAVGSALITITGGVGFNVGQPDQAGLTHISIRSGNGTPKGLNMVAYRFHSALSPFTDFCYVPVSGDEYDIYLKCAGAYGNQLIFDFSYSPTASGVDYSLVTGTTTMPSGGVVGVIREIYTTAQKPTAEDVGADAAGTAASVVAAHEIKANAHASATTVSNGYMSSADKVKLDGIETGAQANVGTNLGYTRDAVSLTLSSSTGLSTTVPQATTSLAGLMSSAALLKLNGIAANANNYVHPSTDGSLHVPATGTNNNGKVLKAGATAGSAAWGNLTASDVGAVATGSAGYQDVGATASLSGGGFVAAVGVSSDARNGFTFRGDSDTGLFSPGDGKIELYLNNQRAIRYYAGAGAVFYRLSAGATWDKQPIVVEDSVAYGSVGIAYHCPSVATAGIFKFYGAGNRFEARNYDDTSFVNIACAAVEQASDYRLKDGVVPLRGSLDVINSLNPVEYTLTHSGKRECGFIAHELAAHVACAVFGEKDAVDARGKPVYQTVDYIRVIPLLAGAVKELSARISELELELKNAGVCSQESEH